MLMNRIATALTLINLLIMAILLTRLQPARAERPRNNVLPVLRGRGLEIIDSLGRIRASITIEPPVFMDGKQYPQTVLLRLTDPRYGPLVKITADANGSAIGLSDEAEGGIQILARDTGTVLRITNRGKERVIKP